MPKKMSDDILKFLPNLQDEEIAQILLQSGDVKQILSELTGIAKPEFPKDPIEFIKKVFGYTLWDKQIAIARSVQDHKNTVISSGHSTGKSFMTSALACWWMVTYDDAVVITLAPTWKQVNAILWRYIRSMARTSGLPGEVFDTPRWNISDLHYAIGLSPKKTTQEDITSLQGYHSEHLLVLMDEAAGMPRIMFEAIFNLATSDDNRVVAIGNPIEQSGPFWEACNNSKVWNYIHISCLDHPNVTTGTTIIPGAVSRSWVDDMVDVHCIESDFPTQETFEWNEKYYLPNSVFKSRVMGIAPDNPLDQLIPSSWIEYAHNTEGQIEGERIIGFDPAGLGGDDAAMVLRHGGKVLWIKRRRPREKNSSDEMAEWLRDEMYANGVGRAYVDEIGLGKGVMDASRRIGLPVIGVNVSRLANQKKRFANLRAQLYWRIRDSLKKNFLELPKDELLDGDLIAHKFSYDYMGRIVLEPKKAVKSRIGRSPDSADALALTFAYGDLILDDDAQEYRFNDMKTTFTKQSRWDINRGRGGSPGSRWKRSSRGGRP